MVQPCPAYANFTEDGEKYRIRLNCSVNSGRKYINSADTLWTERKKYDIIFYYRIRMRERSKEEQYASQTDSCKGICRQLLVCLG